MKRGTKTWKLWAMFCLNIVIILVLTSLYAEYVVSRELNGFLQLLTTITLLGVLAYCVTYNVSLIKRILKRKRLW